MLTVFRWQEAVKTLGQLHRVDAYAVGLGDFGRPGGFYGRQVKTLSTVSASQSQVQSRETKQKVGQIPYIAEMTAFFDDPSTQPRDRSSLIHGDYKIDNLVFHSNEPRVIGILE